MKKRILLLTAIIIIVIVGIFISKTDSKESNTNTLNNSQNTTYTNNTVINTNDNKENNSVVNTNNNKENNTVKNTNNIKENNTVKNTNNNKENNTVKNTNNNKKNDTVKNTNDNKENDTVKNTNDNKENDTVVNTNDNKENNSDIIGTWNTYQAIDSETGKKLDDLKSIFGSSYTSYGSYLKLNEDGTFLDSIYSVTTEETSTTGTYTVEKDYYKLGDCYVFLKYSDGRTLTLQQVNYGDNIPVLTYYPDNSNYQFDLKK